MPNRFGRQVPLDDYTPKPLLPEGLIPVARPDGSFESEMASATNRLASVTGAMADEAAREEGKQAGKTAGLDPHYRPDGSLTIRGQAFNEAATRTYENNLDAKLRTELQNTFEAHRDNPQNLKKAFDALQAKLNKNDVFDSIRGDFNAQFTRFRIPYENKALGNFESLTQAGDRASLVSNVSATQTNIARMAAADPNNPITGQNIEIELGRVDRMIDEQVASQAITADAGAKLKIKNRDDALQTAALAQASALPSPEAIEAYRKNVKDKFASGKFSGLTADGYTSLDASLQQLAAGKRTQINTGVAQLTKNINDHVDRVASGLPVPPDEWTALATSEASRSPNGAQAVAVGEAKVKIATAMSRMSIADGSLLVAGLRAEASKGGATAPDAAVITFAEEQLNKQRTAINTDQLGYAANKRLIPAVAPIDFQGFAASNDPAAAGVLAAQFRDRTAQARSVAGTLSRSPQFLRPEETERLAEIVQRGGPHALALAGAIVKGAGTDAPAILKEISTDAPLLAQAGNIIANGGSQAAARDAFAAAKLKADNGGKDLPGLQPNTAGRIARETFGNAYTMQGGDAAAIRTTADAIAKSRIASGSVDPKGSDAEAIYKRALQEAAGARFVNGVQYGGVADYKPGYWSSYKVPVPSSIRADAFRDVIRAFRDDDLAALPVPPLRGDGKPYSARDVALAIPIAVSGGYRFSENDPSDGAPRFIRGADGAPFVLPFDALQKVAPRISGAFLGGS